jgi:hypothetical protein
MTLINYPTFHESEDELKKWLLQMKIGISYQPLREQLGYLSQCKKHLSEIEHEILDEIKHVEKQKKLFPSRYAEQGLPFQINPKDKRSLEEQQYSYDLLIKYYNRLKSLKEQKKRLEILINVTMKCIDVKRKSKKTASNKVEKKQIDGEFLKHEIEYDRFRIYWTNNRGEVRQDDLYSSDVYSQANLAKEFLKGWKRKLKKAKSSEEVRYYENLIDRDKIHVLFPEIYKTYLRGEDIGKHFTVCHKAEELKEKETQVYRGKNSIDNVRLQGKYVLRNKQVLLFIAGTECYRKERKTSGKKSRREICIAYLKNHSIINKPNYSYLQLERYIGNMKHKFPD